MRNYEPITEDYYERQRTAALSAAYKLILEAGSRAQERVAATPETPRKDVGVAASSASAAVPDAHTKEG